MLAYGYAVGKRNSEDLDLCYSVNVVAFPIHLP